MAYTRTWDASNEAAPAATDVISGGDDAIRNLKVDVRERIAKDHYMDIAGTDADHGEHTQVTLRKKSAKPTAAADKGYVYTKIVTVGATSRVELFYENENGDEVQLTSQGALPTALPTGVTIGGVAPVLANGSALQQARMNSGGTAYEWADPADALAGLDALLAAQGDLPYAATAGSTDNLAIGAANLSLFVNAAGTLPEWAATNKIITFTRAGNASTADVAYTGVGFKPSAIVIICGVTSSFYGSIGVSDGTNEYCWQPLSSGFKTTLCAYVGGMQSGAVLSFDTDGLTISWTKLGSDSSTINGIILCFR